MCSSRPLILPRRVGLHLTAISLAASSSFLLLMLFPRVVHADEPPPPVAAAGSAAETDVHTTADFVQLPTDADTLLGLLREKDAQVDDSSVRFEMIEHVVRHPQAEAHKTNFHNFKGS